MIHKITAQDIIYKKTIIFLTKELIKSYKIILRLNAMNNMRLKKGA